MKKLISLFIVFATLSGVTLGKTVYVNANHPANGDGTSWSSPYTNLQTAVTAAVARDLVLVTNGVYSPISTGNKAITIQSVEGYTNTVIDAKQVERCANIAGGAIIDGFTFVNGGSVSFAGAGGGVHGNYSGIVKNSLVTNCVVSPSNYGGGLFAVAAYDSVIAGCSALDGGGMMYGSNSNCILRGNTASRHGGAAYACTTIDSIIVDNIATAAGGGLAYCQTYSSEVYGNTAGTEGGGIVGNKSYSVYDSVISNNTCVSNGGGIYNLNIVSNCVVAYNSTASTTAGRHGGGINAASLVIDCDIYGNEAKKYDGGGVYNSTVMNSTIHENRANGQGGGVGVSTVIGCTISGNTANTYGGGSQGGTLTGCTLSGNTSKGSGGGSVGGTLTGCVISNNVTTLYDGGGTHSSTVTNCIISGNTANRDGGGSYGGTLTDCVISGNTANRNGGGSANGTLIGCTLSGNTSKGSGGGSVGGTLTGCTISGNTANQYGGGSNSGTLTGCTISGNTANQRGGGFNASTLFNSVISNNIAVVNGGGGYNGIINSCIVVGNTAPVGSQIRNQDNNFYAYNSTIIGECSFANTTRGIFNNIFYGANITFPPTAQVGFNTFSGTLTGGTIVGPNLASTDPKFTDPANNDFTLLPTSPCINKGANQYVTTATDLLGNPRIFNGTVDMGAYEWQSTRFVVTPNALFPMGTKDVK